ncbi:MAG: hypothetical protein GYB31_12705 [Bacteroidetes bacterium]|nr:hypothetical protein [Bacteroidota bacterium]
MQDPLYPLILKHPLQARAFLAFRRMEAEYTGIRLHSEGIYVAYNPEEIRNGETGEWLKTCQDLLHLIPILQEPEKEVSVPIWKSATPAQRALIRNQIRLFLLPALQQLDPNETEELQRLGLRAADFLPFGEWHYPRWEAILRAFVKKGLRSRLRYSRHRISRRYGSSPGLKIQSNARIGIAVDQSGSISEDLLQAFWDEINRIYRYNPALILCQFDHRILKVQDWKPGLSLKSKGGGGTDFNQAIRWAKEASVQGLIVLTDGQAAPPLLKPDFPLLWAFAQSVQSELQTKQLAQFPGEKLFLQIHFSEIVAHG